MSHSVFKCNYENAKKSLFKSFNAIFGKIGRYASADVIVGETGPQWTLFFTSVPISNRIL